MSTPLLNCFWIGPELPDSQIFSSASRSKFPAVSTAKCVMDLYGTLWYSIFLPVRPLRRRHTVRESRSRVNPQRENKL